MPVSNDELVEAILRPIDEAFKSSGITPTYLAKKLKRELNAKENKAQIPKGENEFVYSKNMIAWDVRQKARQDAHQIMGDYPAKRHEIAGEKGEPIKVTFVEDFGTDK
jgi:hypothetical protein